MDSLLFAPRRRQRFERPDRSCQSSVEAGGIGIRAEKSHADGFGLLTKRRFSLPPLSGRRGRAGVLRTEHLEFHDRARHTPSQRVPGMNVGVDKIEVRSRCEPLHPLDGPAVALCERPEQRQPCAHGEGFGEREEGVDTGERR